MKQIKGWLKQQTPKAPKIDVQSFIDNIDKGVFRVDPRNEAWVLVNPPIFRMLGYDTRKEFLKIPFTNHFHRPAHARRMLGLSQVEQDRYHAQIPMVTKDGTILQVVVNAVANEDSPKDRWIDGTFETITDLTSSFETITDLINNLERMKRLNAAYESFVPQKLLTGLGKDNIGEVRLNDRKQKKMTILFSDIRSFSSLSERMSLEENFNFINSYLSWMSPCVRRNNGFINKYIGDAIMALFDGDADDALRCAIEMLNELKQFNKGRERAGYRSVEIGIGLNTGTLMMGTVGVVGHMEGTVIGDAVNAAARMEALTKKYQAPLLISEHTYHALKEPHKFSTRFVDRALVKGRNEPIAIYEVFDADPPDRFELKSDSKATFESAMYHFLYHDMEQGQQMLKQLQDRYPGDPVLKRYEASQADTLKQDISPWKNRDQSELKDELICDIPILDDDHVELFCLTEELMENVKRNRSDDIFIKGLITLRTKASRHFQMEEEMMRQSNYPEIDYHINLHDGFLKNIESILDIQANIQQEQQEIPLHLLLRIETLFVEWLVNHEIVADRHYISSLMSYL